MLHQMVAAKAVNNDPGLQYYLLYVIRHVTKTKKIDNNQKI